MFTHRKGYPNESKNNKKIIISFFLYIKVSTIVHDINQLLCNKCLEEVYGMTLSMHLLKELKSYGRFSELLSAKYSSYHKDFTCLSTVSVDIQQLEECHLFPFLVAFGKGNILKDLYERVSRAMLTAHTSQNKKIGPLISVTEDWLVKSL